MRLPLILLGTCLLGACAGAPPPPLAPPGLEYGVRHMQGTILSGPNVAASPDLPNAGADMLAVTFRVTYLDAAPSASLAPLGTRTRLITTTRGGRPLLAAALLASGARVAEGRAAQAIAERLEGGALGRTVPVGEFHAAVPVDATALLQARCIEAIETPELALEHRRLAILLSRERESKRPVVALLIEDLDPEAPGDAGPERPSFWRQTVLLEDAPEIDGAPLLLMLPSRLDLVGGRSFVVRIDVRHGSPEDPTHAEAVARCSLDLEAERSAAYARTATLSELQADLLSIDAALGALELDGRRRQTLAFLAERTQARFALDVALLADDELLAAWAKALREAQAQRIAQAKRRVDVAWLLDQSALHHLAERLAANELPRPLQALLSRHLGAAGRFPGALTAALAHSTDHATLDAAVRAENLEFLDSMEPAARVRAFDWLAARELAPAGYDPLGPRAERRRALASAPEKEQGKQQ